MEEYFNGNFWLSLLENDNKKNVITSDLVQTNQF